MWLYIMKSKIKVEYLEADNLEELNEITQVSIEAIQVNIKNKIKDIKTFEKSSGGYLIQITYEETEEPQILKESVKWLHFYYVVV